MDENTLKFKYGTTDYDANQIAEYLHDNAQGWLQSQGLTGKKGEAALASINDLIGRIQSGDIDNVQFDGVVNSKSGTFNDNSKDKKFLGIKVGHDIGSNNIAAEFLNQGLMQLKGSNLSSTSENPKEKFGDKDRIHQAWINKYFGGRDPGDDLEQVWSNRDVVNEEGIRARTNRLNEFAGVLDSLYNDSSLNDLDYNGSAFTNADAYREALRNASNAARSGNYDEFLRAYAAAGGDTKAANIMFSDKLLSSTTSKEPEQKTELEETIAQKQEEWKKQGFSEEQIARMSESLRKEGQNALNQDYLKITENEDWNNHFNSLDDSIYSITQNPNSSLRFNDWTDADANEWYGYHITPENEEERAQKYNSGKYAKALKDGTFDRIINNLISGNAIANEDHKALRAYLHYSIDSNKNVDKNLFEKLDNGEYLFKKSYKNGKGLLYNPATKQLYWASAKKNYSLKSKMNKEWKKQRYAQYKKSGGKLDQFKVLKAQYGASLKKQEVKKERQRISENKQKAASEGRDYKQWNAGHKTQSFSDPTTFDTATKARLAGIALDTAGLIASLTGYGDVVNVGTNIGSIGANVFADMIDNSMSTGQKWTNGLTQVGLSTIGLIPGMESFKILNNARKIAKPVLNVLKYGALAGAAIKSPEYIAVWEKALDPKAKFTVDDWKTMAESVKLISAATNKGTRMVHNSKYAKEAGLKSKTIGTKEFTKEKPNLEGKNWIEKQAEKLITGVQNKVGSVKNSASNIVNKQKAYEVADKSKFQQFKENASKKSIGWLKHDRQMWLDRNRFIAKKEQPSVSGYLPDLTNSSLTAPVNSSAKTTIDLRNVLADKKIAYLNRLKSRPEFKNAKVYWNDSSKSHGKIISDTQEILFKQGGKVNQLKVLRQGDSIQKFNDGANMYPTDGTFKIPTMDDNNSWYWNRWVQHELGGRNANATVGNSTPLAGADHNKDFTLGMAYAKNDAYTGQSNLVRNDLQNYIDKGGDDYSDLASLVNGYNKHIGTLNNFWQNDGYTANVASDATAAHNDLFRRLYASRSDNSSNDLSKIGWQEDGVAGKRYMGTSTWLRRADQYADKFADLKNDNDIRNRLHQVTLKNGTKGYVYKESDGTIGIADNTLLQRLGLDGTSNNPQTPQNPNQNPQVQQDQNGAHRVDLNQAQSVLKNLKLGTLLKDSPWNKIANYIDANQVNKEMLDLANKETTALQRHTPITDNVRNGFSQEQFANRMADNIKRAGATAARNTTDAATAMSMLMDANAKADETRQQGKVASDQITEQSKQNVIKYRDNNIAQADADFNENNAKLAALHNSILTNKSGKLVQDHANRVQFRNDIKAWMDTKEQNQRQFKAKAMSQQVQYLMDNIQRKYKLQYQNASEADKPKIIAAMQKEQAELQSKVMPIYYNNLAKINGINDFDFNQTNPFEEMKTWTWRLPTNKKEGGKLEQLVSLKKGGSTNKTSDDGPRRTRAKDLDRHEKNRKNYADQVEKKKERLARLKGKYVDRYLK